MPDWFVWDVKEERRRNIEAAQRQLQDDVSSIRAVLAGRREAIVVAGGGQGSVSTDLQVVTSPEEERYVFDEAAYWAEQNARGVERQLKVSKQTNVLLGALIGIQCAHGIMAGIAEARRREDHADLMRYREQMRQSVSELSTRLDTVASSVTTLGSAIREGNQQVADAMHRVADTIERTSSNRLALESAECYRFAERAHSVKDHSAAIRMLRRALDVNPTNVPAMILMGRCAILRGRVGDAYDILALAYSYAKKMEVRAVRRKLQRELYDLLVQIDEVRGDRAIKPWHELYNNWLNRVFERPLRPHPLVTYTRPKLSPLALTGTPTYEEIAAAGHGASRYDGGDIGVQHPDRSGRHVGYHYGGSYDADRDLMDWDPNNEQYLDSPIQRAEPPPPPPPPSPKPIDWGAILNGGKKLGEERAKERAAAVQKKAVAAAEEKVMVIKEAAEVPKVPKAKSLTFKEEVDTFSRRLRRWMLIVGGVWAAMFLILAIVLATC